MAFLGMSSYASHEFLRTLSKWTRVVLCFLLALLTSPAWLLFGVIVVIGRILVTIHFKVVHEGKFRLCSPSDSAYAVENDGNTISIYAFCCIRGQTDIYKLQSRVAKQLLEYTTESGDKPFQKLTWKLVEKYGYFAWEDCSDNFDVRDHVRLLPGTDADQVYSEEHATQQISKMIDYIMPSKRPQWELLYVPKVINLESGSDELHYITVLRVQHAYMDGISVCQFLSRVLSDHPPKIMIIDPVNPPGPKLSAVQRLGLYTQAFFMAPYTYASALSTSNKNVFQDIYTDEKVTIGPKFLNFSRKIIPFDTLKRMRVKLKCTTSAIFHSAIAGALRKAAERKLLPIPEEVDTCCTLAMFPYPHEGPQNRFTVKIFQAPMSCTDPLKRLGMMMSVMKTFEPHEVLSLFTLSCMIGLIPVKIIRLIYKNVKCGCVVSNLPAFADKLIQFGNPVEKIYGTPPVKDSTGFGIGLVSYANHFRVTWLVEKSRIISSVQDFNALIEDFNEEFEMLECMANKDA